ncbi:uncharacterized protein LOC125654469 isoform X2 [Ostrea edulis]|nr:uncharacterized protein LOC125654469 isoform X2 [Ostrea edulis]
MQCVKWVTECQSGDDHSNRIVKRDTWHSTTTNVHNTSTNLTSSTRFQANTLTLSVSGSAIVGLLLGMMTMFLIIWRCEKRKIWKPSSFPVTTEESGILHPEVGSEWRDTRSCRVVNENVHRNCTSCEERSAESNTNSCSRTSLAELEGNTICSSYRDEEKNHGEIADNKFF